jgi:uncharacterized protein YegL
MRIIPSVLVVTVGIILGVGVWHVSAADEDGVALGILYDTSGSMKEHVPNSHGSSSPKYVIANHALMAVVKQLQTFTTNGTPDAPHKVDVGLFTFDKNGAKEVVQLAPFDAGAIQNFAANFNSPDGGTPLGSSLRRVARAVLDSPMPRKHILVITDGENTIGPDPAAVLPGIIRGAEKRQSAVFVHFIAFDVDAKVFNAVKKQGATVASAADESQLNSQLDFILQNQILLEKPSKTK